ncbi:MAG TPA: hypothetical protein VHZ24_18360 [Pirellulales bacterium]|jgi:hypothetical protein|nr:hypothetical protein [Pirellulales bacterium]
MRDAAVHWLSYSIVWLALAVAASGAYGQGTSRSSKAGAANGDADAGPIADYRAQHFYMHTDLSADEAKELLGRLEVMLELVSGYWGRPPRGVIEMYVIKDLKVWPKKKLDPEGVRMVAAGGGITLTQTLGYDEGPLREIIDAKSVVYAGADHGTPQHEAVHAYCGQTFGRCGPVWYSEGMAEMGNYWKKGDKTVNVHPAVIEHIRTSKLKTLNAIVNNNEATGDSWQNYAWRWALCHLLENNPNYKARFRPLGLDLLMNRPTTFEQVYGDMANEMSFEYVFFLEHLQNGYRVDLCSWDWKKKFSPVVGTTDKTSRIMADHGWQPTQGTLKAGEHYLYSATGSWKTSAGGSSLTAAGDSEGRGKLMGVIMKDYKLGKPFPLGANGELEAPDDGNLYVRCDDTWNELADNTGSMTFKIKLKPAK